MTIQSPCHVDNNEIAVANSDTGPGIAPQEVEKLLEPFNKTKEGGSGLGLPICHDIIKQHAGLITGDSSPGIGTITVWLPINPPKSAQET